MSFRLAAQESTLPGATLEERFEAAVSYGFDGIELGAQGEGRFAARAEELRRARANGVVMPSAVAHTPLFVGDFDPARRRTAIDDVKSILSTLPEAGAAGLVMPNGFAVFSTKLPPFSPPRDASASRAALVEALVELGEHGDRVGAKVFLEPLNRYEDYLINTLAEAVSVVREVDSPAVCVIADTFHMSIEETDIGAAIRAADYLIEHVQRVEGVLPVVVAVARLE
uniref:sugar phosphate isomerase/epimerase family protein n=1 Tax=uncultured Amnibacterium sp. TaxID=1631851 RepID=UPI0035CB3946